MTISMHFAEGCSKEVFSARLLVLVGGGNRTDVTAINVNVVIIMLEPNLHIRLCSSNVSLTNLVWTYEVEVI